MAGKEVLEKVLKMEGLKSTLKELFHQLSSASRCFYLNSSHAQFQMSRQRIWIRCRRLHRCVWNFLFSKTFWKISFSLIFFSFKQFCRLFFILCQLVDERRTCTRPTFFEAHFHRKNAFPSSLNRLFLKLIYQYHSGTTTLIRNRLPHTCAMENHTHAHCGMRRRRNTNMP